MSSKQYALEINWAYDHNHTELVTFAVEEYEKESFPLNAIIKKFLEIYSAPTLIGAKPIRLFKIENEISLGTSYPPSSSLTPINLHFRLIPICIFENNEHVMISEK